MAKLVLLKAFYHKHDAEMALGLLKDSGIEGMLQSDDAGGFRPHLTLSMGNNRVMVQKQDLAAAKEAIKTIEESISSEELKHLEEEALKAQMPASPKRRQVNGMELPMAVVLVIAVSFVTIFVLRSIHQEKYYPGTYLDGNNCLPGEAIDKRTGACLEF